jgi:hypothetical protein
LKSPQKKKREANDENASPEKSSSSFLSPSKKAVGIEKQESALKDKRMSQQRRQR